MFYKAVKDGKIVDVFNDSELVYVRWDDFLNIPVRCKENESPFGVLASDASVIYALDGRSGYDAITLKEFDNEAEYNSLKEEIVAARTPDYVEPENPDEETVDPGVLNYISAEEALNIIMGVYE